jgi:hypothetical protein
MPSGAVLTKRPRQPRRRVTGAALTPFISRITLAEAVADQPRTSWAQVLRTGDFYDPRYGDFAITRKDLARMVDNFTTGKYPVAPTKLCVDYTHGTSRPSSAEEGKAAGWILSLELRGAGDELWAQVEWTENAATLIEAKEYQFTSATFNFDYTNSNGGEDIGPTLQAFAICNRPVVHGMEPLSLAVAGAVRLADASDEVSEALFSFDEQRRRVQAALTAIYGQARYDDYGSCCGVYLQDLYDGFAIFGDYNGNKYRLDVTIAADGTVTFTSEPVEVRIVYEPLTSADAPAEELSMSTIKVKDAKGNEIELSPETVAAIAKDHAPKPAAGGHVDLAAFDKLQGEVLTLTASHAALQAKNDSLELAAKTATATAKVDTLIREGKLRPVERVDQIALALANPEMFDKLAAHRAVDVQHNTRVGSESDNGSLSASDECLALAKAEQDKDAKLTTEKALTLVFKKNPELYDRYKAESAVRV